MCSIIYYQVYFTFLEGFKLFANLECVDYYCRENLPFPTEFGVTINVTLNPPVTQVYRRESEKSVPRYQPSSETLRQMLQAPPCSAHALYISERCTSDTLLPSLPPS